MPSFNIVKKLVVHCIHDSRILVSATIDPQEIEVSPPPISNEIGVQDQSQPPLGLRAVRTKELECKFNEPLISNLTVENDIMGAVLLEIKALAIYQD